jgi:uncharacterized protein (DUF924 family)
LFQAFCEIGCRRSLDCSGSVLEAAQHKGVIRRCTRLPHAALIKVVLHKEALCEEEVKALLGLLLAADANEIL